MFVLHNYNSMPLKKDNYFVYVLKCYGIYHFDKAINCNNVLLVTEGEYYYKIKKFKREWGSQ